VKGQRTVLPRLSISPKVSFHIDSVFELDFCACRGHDSMGLVLFSLRFPGRVKGLLRIVVLSGSFAATRRRWTCSSWRRSNRRRWTSRSRRWSTSAGRRGLAASSVGPDPATVSVSPCRLVYFSLLLDVDGVPAVLFLPYSGAL
jgi:hypothetical protein